MYNDQRLMDHPTLNLNSPRKMFFWFNAWFYRTSSSDKVETLHLTPKGPDCVFWLYSDFGQVPTTINFHILG